VKFILIDTWPLGSISISDKEEVPSREACSATTASNRSSALFGVCFVHGFVWVLQQPAFLLVMSIKFGCSVMVILFTFYSVFSYFLKLYFLGDNPA
jgi:hypothetical protein